MSRAHVLITVSLILAGPMAAAQSVGTECDSDVDCGAELVCGAPVQEPCPMADCPPDVECPVFTCEPQTHRYCEPKPCAGDDDCGEGLACVTITTTSCSSPTMPVSCDAEGNCTGGSESEPSETTCDEESASYCLPRWAAPCVADVDCGPGFSCVEMESCACSGGGSSDPAVPDGSGGADEPSSDGAEGTCSCTGSGELYCEPEQVPCAADGDCLEGWTCEAMGTATCSSSSGDGGAEVCTTSEESYCAPPGWDTYAGAAGGPRDAAGEPMADGDSETQGSAPTNDGASGASSSGDSSGDEGSGCAASSGSAMAALIVMALMRSRRRYGRS